MIALLLFFAGETFRGLMDKYLRNSLKKGVPSIFVSIKLHYKNPEKVRPSCPSFFGCFWRLTLTRRSCSLFFGMQVRMIEELVSGYLSALRKCNRLELNGMTTNQHSCA